MKRKRITNIIAIVLCSLLLFISLLCFFSARWYIGAYGNVGFDSILYTLLSGLEGVEGNLIGDFILKALVPTIILTAFFVFLLFAKTKKRLILTFKNKFRFKLYPFSNLVSSVCSIVLAVILLFSAAAKVDMVTYIKHAAAPSSPFFDEYYIDPSTADITFPEEKQNLIYIYLESMETTFLSQELGGGNDINAIPELYSLAEENTNFSHNSSVGGFSSLSGSTWTIAAMVSQTSGVPLKTPLNIGGNDYGQTTFLPGITTITDVLHENGYYQTLMVGSDADFGGRRRYYEQHGVDKIYDLYTARQDGIVPDDYLVWWGMEDFHLFDYAKQELTKIAAGEQPFVFTMLTADTHHIDGYFCKYCEEQHPEQYENVLSCSSRQVTEFVRWIQDQDFYENTTIIICGDHPTMDAAYIERNIPENYERKIYNCFINSMASTDNTKNRVFSSMDMFPTTLAAIGCTIEGDRLGLGTNLFSDTPTLCEQLGKDTVNSEIAKKSDYYSMHFYFKK